MTSGLRPFWQSGGKPDLRQPFAWSTRIVRMNPSMRPPSMAALAFQLSCSPPTFTRLGSW